MKTGVGGEIAIITGASFTRPSGTAKDALQTVFSLSIPRTHAQAILREKCLNFCLDAD
jgi:hypothetical protein